MNPVIFTETRIDEPSLAERCERIKQCRYLGTELHCGRMSSERAAEYRRTVCLENPDECEVLRKGGWQA